MIIDRRPSRLVTLGITVALCAASCSKKDTAAVTTTPSCSYSVVQPTTSFGPEGGTGSASITVTAGTGCAWTAASSAPFITFTTGSGTGQLVVPLPCATPSWVMVFAGSFGNVLSLETSNR